MAYKPGSVTEFPVTEKQQNGNHSSGNIITDMLKQPTLRQPDKDARLYEINRKVAVCLEFGLASNRACRAIKPFGLCGELLPPLFTLTNALSKGGLFSVTLSIGSPRPDVIRYCVLGKPGLSSTPKGQRLPNHLTVVL